MDKINKKNIKQFVTESIYKKYVEMTESEDVEETLNKLSAIEKEMLDDNIKKIGKDIKDFAPCCHKLVMNLKKTADDIKSLSVYKKLKNNGDDDGYGTEAYKLISEIKEILYSMEKIEKIYIHIASLVKQEK